MKQMTQCIAFEKHFILYVCVSAEDDLSLKSGIAGNLLVGSYPIKNCLNTCHCHASENPTVMMICFC